MTRPFWVAGAILSVLCLVFGVACDLVDYRPSGQPAVSPEEHLITTIELVAAPDTIALWGATASLQYSTSTTYGGNTVLRLYLDDVLVGEVPDGEPLLLGLEEIRSGFHQLRVEAVASLGRSDAEEQGERVIGRLERVAYVERGSISAVSNARAGSSGGYLALHWQPSSSFSVYGYALHYRHRVDTVYARSASTWVDSAFTGGDSDYAIEALSRRVKVPTTPVQVRSDDATISTITMQDTGARLEWHAPTYAVAVQGFIVERQLTWGEWTVLDTLRDPAARTYVDPAVGLGPDVLYRVRSLGGREHGCVAWYDCVRWPFVSFGNSKAFSPGIKVPVQMERVFDPSTGTLVGFGVGCGDGTACVVRAAVGGTTPLQQHALAMEMGSLAVAADGAIYVAYGHDVFKLDPATLAPVGTATTYQLAVQGIRVGQLSAAANGTLVLRGAVTDGHGTMVEVPSFFVGSFPEKRPLAHAPSEGTYRTRISPDGRLVVSDERVIHALEGDGTLRHVRTIPWEDFSADMVALITTPDFRHSILTTSSAIAVSDLTTGALEQRIETGAMLLSPHIDPVTGYLGSVTDTGRYHVYRLSDGERLHDVPAPGDITQYALYDNTLYYGPDRCLPLD